MHNNKFKTMAVAAAALMSVLLTSCSNHVQQTEKSRTAGEISQTSAETTAEPTTQTSSGSSAEPTTAKPLDLVEDLSKYDLKDGDSLEQIVSKMENKYGIDIVYGNDIRTEFKDENETLRAKPNTNDNEIAAALKDIDEGLNALPKGFIKQLPYGKHKILKMYLTGPITIDGVDRGGVPAFTSDSDEELYLTIEVLEQGVVNVPTVLHELTHIIDFKLHYDGIINEDDWSKLNPEGFAYDNSYGDSLAGKKDPKYCYTTDHYVGHNTDNSNDDIWFYYCYSKVNAYEDRATMLENLVVYRIWNYEIAEGLYKCPHMKAKMEYYLKLIEKDFAMNGSDRDSWADAFRKIS